MNNHMCHYIFVKKSPSIELGHLYEHIIYTSLVDLLSSKKLYKYVDYDLVAKTYHGGIIYIELQSYTSSIKLTSRDLRKLDFNLDEAHLLVAINQVSAESAQAIKLYDPKEVLKRLHTLHAQKWESIDDLEEIDVTKSERTSSEPSVFSEKSITTEKLQISIKNDEPIDRELLPLARQMSKVLSENLADTFCDVYGLFNDGDDFQIKDRQLRLNTSLLASDNSVDLEDGYQEVTRELVKAISKDGAFQRFGRHLRSMSYSKQPLNTVNIERTYEDTLIFIGSKGWKKLATDKNITKILQSTTVELKFKKTTLLIPLHDVTV